MCRGACDAGLFQNPAVNAAQYLAHEFDGGLGIEIGAMNRFSGYVSWKEVGAINVPDVVGLWLRGDERRASG